MQGTINLTHLRNVEDARNIEARKKRKCKTKITNEEVVAVTDHAGANTHLQTQQWWAQRQPSRPLSLATIAKYRQYLQKHNRYFVPGAGGMKKLLSDDELKQLLQVFDRWRVKGVRVDCNLFARAARGICKRSRPHQFVSECNGHLMFSNSWARRILIDNGMKPLRATTTRLVPPKEVVEQGRKFYSELARLNDLHGFHPGLVLNVDEFFVFSKVTTNHGAGIEKVSPTLRFAMSALGLLFPCFPRLTVR